jgi:A/G-specific adenine glycosylase
LIQLRTGKLPAFRKQNSAPVAAKALKLSPRRKRNLQNKLVRWYLSAHRRLPWRETRDPYAIWISEIMLQQTQTQKVLEYYDKFLRQFPDLHALAAAKLDDVLKAWEGMGYYARARNLHKAAKHVAGHLQGNFPAEYDQLLRIPGIGPYTAAAVASIAFDRDHAVVDGNVERGLSRIFLIDVPPQSTSAKPVFRLLAQDFLLRNRARDWNQALMELGALICTPKNPHCEECPAQNYCGARLQLADPGQLPRRRDKARRPHRHLAAGLIWKYRRLLIDQRPENGLLGGLWEFPGGKILPGESAQTALRREIRTALSVEVAVGKKLMEIDHGYTHYSITLHVYDCRYVRGRPRTRGCQAWKWVRPEELRHFAFPTANRKIIDALLHEIREQ